MFNNITAILKDISENQKYSYIFDTIESKYFAPNFNSKVDLILSNHTNEEIIKYYMGYKEILDLFLIMVLQNSTQIFENKLERFSLSDEKLKLILLLMYKEIDFFVLKIETLLSLDENPLITSNYNEGIILKFNEEIINLPHSELNILKELGLNYYLSEKKVQSYIEFIKDSEELLKA